MTIAMSDKTSPHVLIVDDNEVNLEILQDMLEAMNYRVSLAYDGEEAIQKVGDEAPDLLLLDIMMPKMDGYEVLQILKGQHQTRLIPIIVVTALSQLDDKVKAIELGADDFLTKPFNRVELEARAQSLLRQKFLNDQLEHAENVVFALAKAIEAKDQYTQGHTDRVTRYAVSVAHKLGLSEREITALKKGGVLHDIGKIGIPDHILNKPGRLTPEEFEIVKQHPAKGAEICDPLKSVQDALPIVRWHHERLDGSGYPDGIMGDQIPTTARIMAVVDVYDALSTDRAYKQALPQEECFSLLETQVLEGWWDAKVVEALIQVVKENASREASDSLDSPAASATSSVASK